MDPAPQRSAYQRQRAAIVLIAVLAVALAWRAGAFDTFGNPERVHALLDAWGAWAYALYLVSFILLMPFGIPAFMWVLPAGLIWPFWVAYPLSLLAVAGASSVGFFFARYVARDWVAARLPGRIRRLDERIAANGLRSVILFRIVFQLGAPTHWVLGLSRIGYGTFVLGTVLGAMPVVALVTWLGHDALHWVQAHVVLAFAIIAAVVVVAEAVRRLLEARRA